MHPPPIGEASWPKPRILQTQGATAPLRTGSRWGEGVAPLPLEPPNGAQLAAVVVLILGGLALLVLVVGPSGLWVSGWV